MLWALLSLGFDWEANDFFYFIADVASGEEKLQVMYGLDGERHLDEQTLDHLEGYEGARPVRVGNGAYDQEQHDVWGALLDSVWIHTRGRATRSTTASGRCSSRQVEEAIKHWREPDRGIWEVRGEPKHFTSSKVFCWVACDRGVAAGRASRGRRAGRSAGATSPTRSTPTSASTASTSAACSSSITRPTRSTPRCC